MPDAPRRPIRPRPAKALAPPTRRVRATPYDVEDRRMPYAAPWKAPPGR